MDNCRPKQSPILDYPLYSYFVPCQDKKEPTPVDSFFEHVKQGYAATGASFLMGDFLERTFIFFPEITFAETSKL
jgi:hypothetical protein